MTALRVCSKDSYIRLNASAFTLGHMDILAVAAQMSHLRGDCGTVYRCASCKTDYHDRIYLHVVGETANPAA